MSLALGKSAQCRFSPACSRLLDCIDSREQRAWITIALGGTIYRRRGYIKLGALPGQGKRGGVRTIVATRLSGHWFFLYGFSKSERNNIDKDELKMLQEIAQELLNLDDRQLAIALAAGEIQEVSYDNQV